MDVKVFMSENNYYKFLHFAFIMFILFVLKENYKYYLIFFLNHVVFERVFWVS